MEGLNSNGSGFMLVTGFGRERHLDAYVAQATEVWCEVCRTLVQNWAVAMTYRCPKRWVTCILELLGDSAAVVGPARYVGHGRG